MKNGLRLLVVVPVLFASVAAPKLAPGDVLPALRGEFLTGKEAVLPDAAVGKVALLLLGFTHDSRFAVEGWATRFRGGFGTNPQVTFYEIPMIGGMGRLGKWFIDSGMRKGTPKADYAHVITVYGGADPWKQRVAFRDPKAAYLIVLDRGGKVVWQHSGVLDEASYSTLAMQVSEALSTSHSNR